MRRGSAIPALAVFAAVAGPGLIAGLSDDDPAGITTYSILGADFGYQLLWVLTLSIVALIAFHELGARMGIRTGRGLMLLVRDRFGVRIAALALLALVVANLGTTCAELAGVAASLELVSVPPWISVPIAAVGVTVVVVFETFARLEHVLLAVSAVFVAYIAAGLLAHPDWGAVAHGLVVPSMPSGRHAALVVTATVGTTLAPWGLAFIQSYAVDKRLSKRDLPVERIDVIVGSVATGVIGAFVVIACAATLYPQGITIKDASDAAKALEPLAGSASTALFGVGLLGAGLLAAAIVPLSTSYSVSEAFGREPHLDERPRQDPLFYGTFCAVMAVAALIVMIPGAPLVDILFLTQALNAVLLVPLLVLMLVLARDSELLGSDVSRGLWWKLELAGAAIVFAAVAALAVLSIT
jgi:NRAMP (natural resistance-associated macrophage protein)-like metal ion transporter